MAPLQNTSGLAAQQVARAHSIKSLQQMRIEARREIDRLIQFLDQSDPYVMTELEEAVDDVPCETDELEQDLTSPDPRTSGNYLGRSPWIARSFDQSRFQGEDAEADDSDDEPSLGSIERHPSCYGLDGRNWSGDQIAWAAGGTKDLEDEHDGAEPGEDAEPSLGWSTSGVMGTCLTDRELDYCDREDSAPLLTECSGELP